MIWMSTLREGKAVKPKHILVGLVAVVATGGLALAQDAPVDLQVGPAAVAPHWTKNTSYPTSIPEGAFVFSHWRDCDGIVTPRVAAKASAMSSGENCWTAIS